MSERDPQGRELDPVETARQVHTLAQRLLQRVSADVRGNHETQPEIPTESKSDDQPVTYWYP